MGHGVSSRSRGLDDLLQWVVGLPTLQFTCIHGRNSNVCYTIAAAEHGSARDSCGVGYSCRVGRMVFLMPSVTCFLEERLLNDLFCVGWEVKP